MTMDDHHPPEELPADLLAQLRAPVEVDPEVVDAQVGAALAEMDSVVVPLRRARSNRRRWLPVAAAIVALMTVGGAILARWQSSSSGSTDQAGRMAESFGVGQDGRTEDRAEQNMAEEDIDTPAGAEFAPRIPGPNDSVIEDGLSSAGGVPTTIVEPRSGMTVNSAPSSCPTGNWWDAIRALFGRCA
jgi:hypothetical protein